MAVVVQNFSVLIADDNDLNRWLLREQLENWTGNIHEASDGLQAWHTLRQTEFRIVFLDVNMPGLDGLALIDKLRTSEVSWSGVPAVAVTAHAGEDQRQAAMAAGFDDYLVKPIRLEHLRQVLDRWLEPERPGEYGACLLRKTGDNRRLTFNLLEQFFAELPGQVAGIDDALQQGRDEEAWKIVHNLHGTFCFFEFADCRALVAALETAIKHDSRLVPASFRAFQVRMTWLTANKAAVMQGLIAD
ncbi:MULTISPECIES: response regulator [Methylomonas]|uniref:Response regulatory domain-containing protein n=1 Tax=Methylomonas koyamae TaxID=702114 RepID=A0A177PFQ4_9GAMM|nr:response regulator [Methylomonas koyamae]OAI29125.1 hypothetical protein A1355_17090 [Methylomonas koyamae]